jgi:hypothetical protein
MPPWPLAIFPLALVIATILAPRLLGGAESDNAIIAFANPSP